MAVSGNVWVSLTKDELWALDTVAVFTLEKRKMPEHIEMNVTPRLGSAIEKLRKAAEQVGTLNERRTE